MGKNDSFLSLAGEFVAAFANEVDIFSPSGSSSPSTPSTSGAGNYSNSSGGSDGYSSVGSLGITDRTNAWGKTVHQVAKRGNTEYVYKSGMLGFFDALLGGKPLSTNVFDGNRVHHYQNERLIGRSYIRSDGQIDSYDTSGNYKGSKTPILHDVKSSTIVDFGTLSREPEKLSGTEYDEACSISRFYLDAVAHAQKEQSKKDYNRGCKNGEVKGKSDALLGRRRSWDYSKCSKSYAMGFGKRYDECYFSTYKSESDRGKNDGINYGNYDALNGSTGTFNYQKCSVPYKLAHQAAYSSSYSATIDSEIKRGEAHGTENGTKDGNNRSKRTRWIYEGFSPAYIQAHQESYEKAYLDALAKAEEWAGHHEGIRRATSCAASGFIHILNNDYFDGDAHEYQEAYVYAYHKAYKYTTRVLRNRGFFAGYEAGITGKSCPEYHPKWSTLEGPFAEGLKDGYKKGQEAAKKPWVDPEFSVFICRLEVEEDENLQFSGEDKSINDEIRIDSIVPAIRW